MRTLLLGVLIFVAVAFDAFALWALVFTLSWSGGVPPLSAIGFGVFALSPIIVTGYCVFKVRALLQGRPKRI